VIILNKKSVMARYVGCYKDVCSLLLKIYAEEQSKMGGVLKHMSGNL